MSVNFQLYGDTFDMTDDNITLETKEEETSLPRPRPRPINHSNNHEKNEKRSISIQHTHHIEQEADNIFKLYFNETVIDKKRKEIKNQCFL